MQVLLRSLLAVILMFCWTWALTVADATSGAYACSKITWKDQNNKDRSVFIVKNSGTMTGVCPEIVYYDETGALCDVTNPGSDPLNNAFGSSTHHGASTHKAAGTLTQKYVGTSMAVFDYVQTIDGTLETITYTFQDGHDYFQWAQTDDNTNATGVKNSDGTTGYGDSRGPYCTMKWNLTGNTAQHVEYGAMHYLMQQVYNTNWTFTGTVDIPYCMESGDGKEVGYVQTQTFAQQLAGSPSWAASYSLIPPGAPKDTVVSGTTIAFADAWKFDFQMCYYDQWCKITWGMPYGFLSPNGGAAAGDKGKFGQYSLSILFDGKAQNGVLRVRNENRAIQQRTAAVAATVGTMTMSGPVGTRNPALQPLLPAGWDHNSRSWWVQTVNNSALLTVTVTPDTMSLVNPTFRLSNMDALPTAVKLNGTDLALNTGYYASYDAAKKEAWVTLVNKFAKGTSTVQFGTSVGVVNPVRSIGAASYAGKSLVSVYTLNGALVAQRSAEISNGRATPGAAGITLPQGSYLMRIRGNNFDVSRRITTTRGN